MKRILPAVTAKEIALTVAIGAGPVVVSVALPLLLATCAAGCVDLWGMQDLQLDAGGDALDQVEAGTLDGPETAADVAGDPALDGSADVAGDAGAVDVVDEVLARPDAAAGDATAPDDAGGDVAADGLADVVEELAPTDAGALCCEAAGHSAALCLWPLCSKGTCVTSPCACNGTLCRLGAACSGGGDTSVIWTGTVGACP